jgi:hypothetical protein
MRRIAQILLGLAGLLLLLSFGLWWWATAKLESGLADWAAQARRDGWQVTYDAPHASGWPVAARLVVPNLSVAGTGAWRAERVVLELSPLRPDEVAAHVSGDQAAGLPGQPLVPFTAATFDITAPLAVPPVLTLTGKQLRFGPPVQGLTVGLLQAQIQPPAPPFSPAEAVDFRVSGEAIALPPPPARQAALGGRIASATAQGTLRGIGPALADPAGWRAAGGTITLRRFALGWGPLGLTGSAEASLDAALQPRGSGQVRVVGYDESLAALVAGGAISSNAAQALRAVLALLARTPEGGGTPFVELPVAVKDRTVSVGSIPVGRVAALPWPAPH